jgi:hypothetical protein
MVHFCAGFSSPYFPRSVAFPQLASDGSLFIFMSGFPTGRLDPVYIVPMLGTHKLRAVHCSTAPTLDWGEQLFECEPEEIALLAHMEHDRWMEEQRQKGWVYAPVRNNAAKHHPCMVSYDELPQSEQEKDIAAVRQVSARLTARSCRESRPG